MASRVGDIQDARALAQKLYGQCRDSNSAYKLLTGSIRKLRNVLEEIEETVDDSSSAISHDEPLQLQAANSKRVLGQLDLALQQHRCSTHRREAPRERAVLELRNCVDVTTHNLSVAFESINSFGEIQLKLDTMIDPRAPSPKLQSASVSASSNERDRKLSQTSSAWSLINRESPDHASASEFTDADMEVVPSDEKEVLQQTPSTLEGSLGDVTLLALDPAPAWRTSFFNDPLSMDLERASRIIMDGSVDSQPLRSRSSTSSTIFIEPPIVATTSHPGSRNVGAADVRAVDVYVASPQSKGNAQIESFEPLSDAHGDSEPQDEQPEPDGAFLAQRVNIDHSLPRIEQFHVLLCIRDERDTVEAHDPSALEIGTHQSPPHATDVPSRGALDGDLHAVSRGIPATTRHQGADTSPTDDGNTMPVTVTLADDTSNSPSAVEQSPRMEQAASPKRRPPPPPTPRRNKQRNADSTTTRPTSAASATHNPEPEVDRKRLSATSYDSKYDSESEYLTSLVPQPLGTRKSTLSIPGISINGNTLVQEDAQPQGQSKERPRAYTAPSIIQAVDTDLDTPLAPPTSKFSQPPEVTSQTAAKTPEQPDKPSVVPRRPSRKAPSRPSAPLAQNSAAALNMKEVVREEGPEVDTRLAVSVPDRRSRHRKSVDELYKVDMTPDGPREALGESAETRMRTRLRLNDSQLKTYTGSQATDSSVESLLGINEFYGKPDADPGIDLDEERKRLIVELWNNSHWDQAEAYLTGYQESLVERNDLLPQRRIRHLLGVCASYKGEWRRSIPIFLSVLRTPIRDISELDDGDCAAAYWLGDSYAMLNQRTEALLAYSIAERGSLFQDPSQPRLQLCIRAEQDACRLDVSSAESKRPTSAEPSILDDDTVTQAAAKSLLEYKRRNTSDAAFKQIELTQNTSRNYQLYSLHGPTPPSSPFTHYQRLKLAAVFFEPNTPWPMMYDPLFTLANVQRGRFLAYEGDLLDVFSINPNAKLPKSGPVGLSRMDCFTCNDLTWLIKTVRECLRAFEMDWSEVANVQGTCSYISTPRYPLEMCLANELAGFVVRYSS